MIVNTSNLYNTTYTLGRKKNKVEAKAVKLAVFSKISECLGKNSNIEWTDLIQELKTKRYFLFWRNDWEDMAMQFFSQAAFFGSSFYDVFSDYLVSEQFIKGQKPSKIIFANWA